MKRWKVRLAALLVPFLCSIPSCGQTRGYDPQVIEVKGLAAGFYLGSDIRKYEGMERVGPDLFRTSDNSVLISTDTEAQVREIVVFRLGVFTQRLAAIGQSTFYDVLQRYGMATSITQMRGLVAVSYPDIVFGFDAPTAGSLQGTIKFIVLRRDMADAKELHTLQFLSTQSAPPQNKDIDLLELPISLTVDIPKLLEPKVFDSEVCVVIGHIERVTKGKGGSASHTFKPFHLYVYQAERAMAHCPDHAKIRAARDKPGNKQWEIAKEGQTEKFEHAAVSYYVKVTQVDPFKRKAEVAIGPAP